jgi:hypothetical protein
MVVFPCNPSIWTGGQEDHEFKVNLNNKQQKKHETKILFNVKDQKITLYSNLTACHLSNFLAITEYFCIILVMMKNFIIINYWPTLTVIYHP